MRLKEEGFTLIELMITIAIVGVLAAVAVPQYAQYIAKARFSDIITQTTSAKTSVVECYQIENSLTSCNGAGAATDFQGMTSNIAAPGRGNLETLTITSGKITAQGTSAVVGATYILEPSVVNGAIQWSLDPTSTCLAEEYCKNR